MEGEEFCNMSPEKYMGVRLWRALNAKSFRQQENMGEP